MADAIATVAPLPVAVAVNLPAPSVTTSTTTVTDMVPNGATSKTDTTVVSTTHKPGLQTSEGWLAFAATMLTGLFGAGIIPTAGVGQTVAVVAAIALTSLGYSVSRGLTKGAS